MPSRYRWRRRARSSMGRTARPVASGCPFTGRSIFAVPPTLPSGRHLRLHRRVIRIHFEMENYDLSGRIHVRPGAEVGDYLLRSSRVFVPITDVELTRLTEPAFSRTLPVVIVNSRHVSRLHLVEGRALRIGQAVPVTPTVHAPPPRSRAGRAKTSRPPRLTRRPSIARSPSSPRCTARDSSTHASSG